MVANYIDPRHKVLYHTADLHLLQVYGRIPAPINVEIDLSNRCSLGCEWCHFSHTHTRGPLARKAKPGGYEHTGDLLDVGLVENILGQLAEAGVKSATWAGGGEPTLHPMFEHIVRCAAHNGLQQGMYTHGGHIDAKRASLLKQLFTWVYVSLDEPDAEQYRHSKHADGFDRATAGIYHLVNAAGNATIGVGFLLHADNYTDISRMVELGNRLDVDYMQFRPTVRYRHDRPGVLDEDTGWVDKALDHLRMYEMEPNVMIDIARFEEYRDWTGHSYSTCNWTAFQTVVTPDGRLWRCLNKRGVASALMGDLNTEPFISIWQRTSGACQVDDKCRVMCRGHLANRTLDAVLSKPKHEAFI